MTEAEELELLELEEEEARLAASPSQKPAQPLSVLQKTAGLIRSAGQGAVPFYDELTAGVRAVADPSTYGGDRSLADRYQYAKGQENQGLEQYRAENPNAAFVAQTGGAFASPLNKLGPVTQGGGGLVNALRGVRQNLVRNTAEGALYGLGEGEGEDALSAMHWNQPYSVVPLQAHLTLREGPLVDFWTKQNSPMP